MKQRALSLLLTLCLLLGLLPATAIPSFAADGEQTAPAVSLTPAESYGDGVDISTGVTDITLSNRIENITKAGIYRLSGTGTAPVIVAAGVEATIVLRNATIKTMASPLQLREGAKVTLVLPKDSVNELTSTASTLEEATQAGGKTAGINVPVGATLVIDRDKASKEYGSLTVNGGYGGAGIGGGAGVGLNNDKRGNNANAGGGGSEYAYVFRMGGHTIKTLGSTAWEGTLGQGGRFGNDGESAGTVEIKSGTLAVNAGTGAAGIGGGFGAAGEDATASTSTTAAGKSASYNFDQAKNMGLGQIHQVTNGYDREGNTRYMNVKLGSAGGAGTGGASGANGGTGGDGGDGGQVTIRGGNIEVKALDKASAIGGGNAGVGGQGTPGNGGTGGGTLTVSGTQWGTTSYRGSNGGRGQDGYYNAPGQSGDGGSLTIEGGRINLSGAKSIGSGYQPARATGGSGHNSGRQGPDYAEIVDGGIIRKAPRNDGGHGGTITAPAYATGADATVKITGSTNNILLPNGWDNNNAAATRMVDRNGEKLYKTEITVTKLDGVTVCPDSLIKLTLHRGNGDKQYIYTTRTDENGVATLWLPVSRKVSTTGDITKDYELYAESADVSHRSVGRIMPDVKFGIEIAANDNNKKTIMIGVDFLTSHTPDASKVYRPVSNTTYELQTKDETGGVNLVIDGRPVPDAFTITRIRWFRESINGNTVEYDFEAKGDKLAFQNGYTTALQRSTTNVGSSDLEDQKAGARPIDMKPETAVDGKKPRVWNIPMNENGRYWVELTYLSDAEGALKQMIVKGTVINNIYTTYPVWVHGQFSDKSAPGVAVSWMYGNSTKYVPLMAPNSTTWTEPFGIPWDLNSYDANAMKDSNVTAELAAKILNAANILKTDTDKGVVGGYDKLSINILDKYLTFYSAVVGNYNPNPTPRKNLNIGARSTPYEITLNADYFTNPASYYGEIVNGKQTFNKYLLTYMIRDGSMSIVFINGEDVEGNRLWELTGTYPQHVTDATIEAWDRPGYLLTEVYYTTPDNENWQDITNRNDALSEDPEQNAGKIITELDKMTVYFGSIADVKEVKFVYKKSTTDVTIKAYYQVPEGEPEREIEGFVPYTVEATFNKDYEPKTLGIDGYELVGSNLTDGKLRVVDPDDPSYTAESNVVKWYFVKTQGNVTYRAVLKDAAGGPDEVVWSKDSTVTRNSAPALATGPDDTNILPEQKNFVPKQADAGELIVKITRKDNDTEVTKYDGVHDLYVTYEYVKRTKDVTIKAVDQLTGKEITVPAGEATKNLTTGESHVIQAPDLSSLEYAVVGQKSQTFFVDAGEANPTVTFYYVSSQKAEVSVTLYYTSISGGDIVENTIQVLRSEVEWGGTVTIQAPALKNYTIVEKQSGVQKVEEEGNVKYVVTLTPTRTANDQGGYDVTGTTAKIKYEKDPTYSVKIKLVDQAGENQNLADLLTGWKNTITVEKGEDATATAPSIPNYRLVDATVEKTLTAAEIAEKNAAGEEIAITFTYEKANAEFVTINVIGKDQDKAQEQLYSYPLQVDVGTTSKEITAATVPLYAVVTASVDTNDVTHELENNVLNVDLSGKKAGDVVTVEFVYENTAADASVTVKLLDASGKNPVADPIVLNGYHKGDVVKIAAPHVLGKALIGTRVVEHTIAKAGENNVVEFRYGDRGNVFFTLVEGTAGGANNKTILTVSAVEGKTYGPNEAGSELNLAGDYYRFTTGNTTWNGKAQEGKIAIEAADLETTGTTEYILYYTKMTRDIQVICYDESSIDKGKNPLDLVEGDNGFIETKTLTAAGRIGETYILAAEQISGYQLAESSSKTVDVTNGADALKVAVKYSKKQAGSVTVNYKVGDKLLATYTVASAVGETFISTIPDPLEDGKYIFKSATQGKDTALQVADKKVSIVVSADSLLNEINMEYEPNFVTIKSYTSDDGQIKKDQIGSYEFIKSSKSDLKLIVPSLAGYDLVGIYVNGTKKTGASGEILPSSYVNGVLTLTAAEISAIGADFDVLFEYKTIEENIKQYQSITTVQEKYGDNTIAERELTWTRGNGNKTVMPTDYSDLGYVVSGYQLDGVTQAISDPKTFAGVPVDISKSTHTLVFTYKRSDNSAAVPGPDNKIGTEDDVIVTPGKDGAEPKVDEEGTVTVPDGGTVVLPDGSMITPPAGSTVKKDGTIQLPNGGGELNKPDDKDPTIDPDNPDNPIPGLDKDLYTVIYLANGGSGEVQVQIVQKGGSVKALVECYTNGNAKFTGWNTDPNGLKQSYQPGAEIQNVTSNLKLYAQWAQNEGQYEAKIQFHKNAGSQPDVTKEQALKGNAYPISGKLEANSFVLELNGKAWTFWRWTKEQNPSTLPVNGENSYLDQAVVSIAQSESPLNLYAQWYLQNEDGSIVIPGKDGKPGTADDITISGPDKDTPPTVNPDGSVDVPAGGTVTEKPKPGTTLPDGGKVNPDGSVTKKDETVIDPSKPDQTTYAWSFTYHANYTGSGETSLVGAKTDGESIKLSGNVFSRTGYVLAGWTTVPASSKDAGTSYAIGATITKAQNPTNLYAVWFQQGDNGELTIPGKDGQLGTGDDITIKPNPANPDEKPSIDGNGNVKVPSGGEIELPGGETIVPPDGTVVKPDGTVVLPAGGGDITPPDPDQPNPVTPPAGYVTVTYKPGAGQGEEIRQIVKKGEAFAVLASQFTHSSAMRFKAWKNEKGEEITFPRNYTTSENQVFTAQWEKADNAKSSATLIFHKDDAANTQETEVIASNDNLPSVSTVLRKMFTLGGWTFAGWDTLAAGGGTHYSTGDVVNLTKDSTKDLYALWYQTAGNTVKLPGKDLLAGTPDDVTINGNNGTNPTVDSATATVTVPAGGTVNNPSAGGEIKLPNGGKVDFNGKITLDKDQTAQLPSGDKVTGPATVKPDGSKEEQASGETVTVSFFDWDGTFLGTRTVRKGGSLTGDSAATAGQRGNDPTQAPLPQEGNTLTTGNGTSVINKAGYTFVGWVEYTKDGSSTPLDRTTNTMQDIEPDRLKSLSNLEKDISVQAAYKEVSLGANVAKRYYNIERGKFSRVGNSLECTVTVYRGATARRGNSSQMYLEVALTPKGMAATTLYIPIDGTDVATATLSLPANAASTYSRVVCRVVTYVDGARVNASSTFTINASDMIAGK